MSTSLRVMSYEDLDMSCLEDDASLVDRIVDCLSDGDVKLDEKEETELAPMSMKEGYDLPGVKVANDSSMAYRPSMNVQAPHPSRFGPRYGGGSPVLPVVTTDDPPLQRAEALMIHEIQELSPDERIAIQNDLCPPGRGPERFVEDPWVLEERLAVMRDYLDHLEADRAEDARAYLIAARQNREYVEDRGFRLMFLRSVRDYCAVEAAERMLIHFSFKLDLFGRDMMGRDVTLDDIEKGRELDRIGMIQMLPSFDRWGRTVMIGTNDRNWLNLDVCRYFWCIVMGALRSDETVQLRGIVIININSGPNRISEYNTLRLCPVARLAIPVRPRAHHILTDDPCIFKNYAKHRYIMDRPNRLRARCHLGKREHFAKTMLEYGIDITGLDVFPKESPEMIQPILSQHLQSISNSIEQRRQQILEESNQSPANPSETSDSSAGGTAVANTINSPRPQDVVFGCGKSREHPGNIELQRLVQDYYRVYQHANRTERAMISKAVMETIHETGGRFLRRAEDTSEWQGDNENTGMWVVVQSGMAREKIRRAFRTLHAKRRSGLF